MKSGTQSMRNPDPLASSLDLIQITIDAISSPVGVVDSEGKILLANKQWRANPSIQPGDINRAIDQILSSNDWEVETDEIDRFAGSLDAVLSGRQNECRLTTTRSAPGREQDVIRARALRVGGAAALIQLDTQTQSAARSREDFLPNRIQSTTFLMDTKGTILEWSPDSEELFGRPEEETIGQHISVIFARKNSRFPSKELLANLEKNSPRQIELRLKTSGGAFFSGSLLLSRKTEEGGVRIECRIDMISERQRAAGALRRAEERLRYALEAASDGLWDWDLKTDGVVFSPRVSEIFEESPDKDGV